MRMKFSLGVLSILCELIDIYLVAPPSSPQVFLPTSQALPSAFVSSELPGLLTKEGMSRLPGLPGYAVCLLSFPAEIPFFLINLEIGNKVGLFFTSRLKCIMLFRHLSMALTLMAPNSPSLFQAYPEDSLLPTPILLCPGCLAFSFSHI